MYKRLAIGITLLLAIMVLVLPAAACPPQPTCPPGEVWGVTVPGHYEWGTCQVCPSHQGACDQWQDVCDRFCNHNHCKQNGDSCNSGPSCNYDRGDCLHMDHRCIHHVTVFDCHNGQEYQSCGENQEQHRHYVQPVYGCVAVSCPAIPCPTGQDCVSGECLLHTCPRIPCESGYTCQDNQCVPDGTCPVTPCNPGYDCTAGQCVAQAPVCEDIRGTWIFVYQYGGDWIHTMTITEYDPETGIFSGTGYYNVDPSYTWTITGTLTGDYVTYHLLYTGTNAGYYVDGVGTIDEDCILMGGLSGGDGQVATWEATKNPPIEELHVSSFSPYTEPACQSIINAEYPMDSIDPKTLPLLKLKNTYISAAFHYASQFDCVVLAYYTKGEPSFSRDCTEVEWYNRVQEEIHTYGGMPVLTAPNPAQAICVLAVKNSRSETTLPVTITLTDSHGNVGDSLVSSNPVIRQCYQLPEDFSECRLQGGFSLHMPWVE